jgi:hypothetical protein
LRAFATLAAAFALAAPGGLLACPDDYTYAGTYEPGPAAGVAARISVLVAPTVADGHVGAWVGVIGRDRWIQVGLSAFPGSPTGNLFLEVSRAAGGVEYRDLEQGLVGPVSRRIMIVEVRPDTWAVLVDGRSVTSPIRLAGSHGRWHPMAIAESKGTCNRYAYRFERIRARHGAAWRRFTPRQTIEDAGYLLVPTASTGFVAADRRTSLERVLGRTGPGR